MESRELERVCSYFYREAHGTISRQSGQIVQEENYRITSGKLGAGFVFAHGKADRKTSPVVGQGETAREAGSFFFAGARRPRKLLEAVWFISAPAFAKRPDSAHTTEPPNERASMDRQRSPFSVLSIVH